LASSNQTEPLPTSFDAAWMGRFSDTLDVHPLTDGGNLLGLHSGQAIYALISHRLLSLPRGSVLLVDLSQVRQASPSALRQVLATLAMVRGPELEERYLIFHVDLDNQDLVQSLQLLARDQKDVIPVVNRTGSWHAFGRLTKSERDTLDIVLKHQEVTSTQLARCLHLLTSAASNRLRRLYVMRLVRRQERLIAGTGGREFVYEPLFH
jgi:hypothetical protein